MIGFRTRFPTEKEIIYSLTLKDLPAPLRTGLSHHLGIDAENPLTKISRVVTRGVGGTQCKPLILEFEDGAKVFLKISSVKRYPSSAEQARADHAIKSHMPEGCEPFVLMQHHVHYSTVKNEYLFFPFIPGDNLFIATSHTYNTNTSAKLRCFQAVGQALAQSHISSMTHQKTFDSFDPAQPPRVLVHDDWQSTNVMVTPEFKGKIIDTEGTHLSNDFYQNIIESWELCGEDLNQMLAFIQGYLNEYPSPMQDNLYSQIRSRLEQKFNIELPNTLTQGQDHSETTRSTHNSPTLS